MAFLDNNGLGTLWGRIKTKFAVGFSPTVSANQTSVTIKLKNGYGNDLDNDTATTPSYINSVTLDLADSTKAGLMSPTEKSKLAGIAEGAEVNVQADWNVNDSTSDAFIKNKPTIPTVPSNIVNKITTTAGAHTAITNETGNVSFNVPTQASHVGAVPTSRTVNGKALSSNITLNATNIHIVSQDVQWETVEQGLLGLEQGLLGLNSSKVDKVTGKGLSTNDYTDAEKTKVGYVDTGKSVSTYVSEQISTAMTGSAKYKGTVGTGGTVTTLPTSGYKQGDYYVVCTAGTYAGETCEVGDMIFANKDYASGAVAADDWDIVQSNITAMTDAEINAICV